MANVSEPAAREYASALFSLAREQGSVQTIYDELTALNTCYRDDAEFRAAFTSPRIPIQKKQALLIEPLANLSPLMKRFLGMLITRRRETLLDNITDAFEKYRDQAENRLHVYVDSAQEMDAGLIASMKSSLQSATGRSVEIDVRVLPELIGGLRIRVGDTLLDATVQRRLRRLAAAMAESKQQILGSGTDDSIAMYERARADIVSEGVINDVLGDITVPGDTP